MPTALRLADLDAMTPQEREEALARLVEEARAPGNGQLALARARVRAFELRYEMSSEQLETALREGKQKETAEIAEWLFWLSLVKRRAG